MINGQGYELSNSQCFVSDALALFLNLTTQENKNTTYAVALNGDFVSKERYLETALTEQDSLDILFPIVGG